MKLYQILCLFVLAQLPVYESFAMGLFEDTSVEDAPILIELYNDLTRDPEDPQNFFNIISNTEDQPWLIKVLRNVRNGMDLYCYLLEEGSELIVGKPVVFLGNFIVGQLSKLVVVASNPNGFGINHPKKTVT